MKTASSAVPIEDLLLPISPEQPSGTNLRYTGLYDKIKEARRQDDDLPAGDWSSRSDRKEADFGLVRNLASDALRTKSKDLWLAVRLLEAETKLNRFAGLARGIRLIDRLLESFWDSIFPEIEDGDDAEMRVATLEWIDLNGQQLVKTVPLTGSDSTRRNLDYYDYQNAQRIGLQADCESDPVRRERYNEALAEGKPTGDDWARAAAEASGEFLARTVVDLEDCISSLKSLEARCEGLFGSEYGPSYAHVRYALIEVADLCRKLSRQKALDLPEKLPDTWGETLFAEPAAIEPEPPAPATAPAVAAKPASAGEAVQRILDSVDFLRERDPYSPTPYLLVRAVRWGELRSFRRPLDPAVLTAPPVEVRQELRAKASARDWKGLLAAAEKAAAEEYGRAWLDPQRHVYRACAELGADHREIQLAVRTATAQLLHDIPELQQMCLSDDTPAANPETLAWLRESVLPADVAAPERRNAPAEEDPEQIPDHIAAVLRRARERSTAGDWDGALAILNTALSRQRTPRLRFRLKAHHAEMCLACGRKAMARSVLEELVGQIDKLHLEEWETHAEIARIYAGLYAVLERTEGHAAQLEDLYGRICRLDPAQAPPR